MATPCPHCGSEMRDDAAMCDRCAEVFASLTPPPPVQPSSPRAPEAPPPAPDAEPAPIPLNETHRMANTALVVTLFGLCVPFAALAGLGMGIVSLGQMRRAPYAYRNRASAILAVVLAAVFTFVHVAAGVAALYAWKHVAYLKAHRQLFLGVNQFIAFAGVPPERLEDLALPADSELDYLPDGGVYIGPFLRGSDGIGGGPIPRNPYARGDTVEDHWDYDPDTAELRSAVPLPGHLPESSEMEPARPNWHEE